MYRRIHNTARNKHSIIYYYQNKRWRAPISTHNPSHLCTTLCRHLVSVLECIRQTDSDDVGHVYFSFHPRGTTLQNDLPRTVERPRTANARESGEFWIVYPSLPPISSTLQHQQCVGVRVEHKWIASHLDGQQLRQVYFITLPFNNDLHTRECDSRGRRHRRTWAISLRASLIITPLPNQPRFNSRDA